MIGFLRQNAWITYRKIDRQSCWFSVTWKLLIHQLNALGPQHDVNYWIGVWDQQVIQARVAASFGDVQLTQDQEKILKLILEHHPCTKYLQNEELGDGESLASTIPLLEDEESEVELILELQWSDEEYAASGSSLDKYFFSCSSIICWVINLQV